jgi:RNA polymerase sigma-70 factor, ECF subfamily
MCGDACLSLTRAAQLSPCTISLGPPLRQTGRVPPRKRTQRSSQRFVAYLRGMAVNPGPESDQLGAVVRDRSTTPYSDMPDPAHRPVPPIDQRPDAELLVAMCDRDESALATLYDRYAATLLGFMMRIVPQRADAESALLETFMQAWRTAHRFDPQRSEVPSWLLMMARTRALDMVRATARHRTLVPLSLQELPAADLDQWRALADPLRTTEQREQDRAIRHALTSLPAPQRDAIELAFFAGLTHPEIAERLGEPLGTIKSRIRGGLLKLREALRFHREVTAQ